jgi:L-asparaginase II
VAFAGDPHRLLFARSSMKPLQATVSLSLARLDVPVREVAVMSASHNAEPVHVEAVRSLLARGGVPESALQCPVVRPWDEESAAADPQPRAINSDCSGKHAGMLSACRAQGWSLVAYRGPGHPLQKAVLEAVLRATGLDRVEVGVDGCGVPVHGMPLAAMARIYATLSRPGGLGELEPFARAVVAAMRAEPYMVAGRNRADTALMQEAPEIVAKGGAEGLMSAALLDGGIGVAVKVADGGSRAAGPALIRALAVLGVLTEEAVVRLGPSATPPVLGGGRPVGRLGADFELTPA